MPATAIQPEAQPASTTRKSVPPPFAELGAWMDAHSYLCLALLVAILVLVQLGLSLRIPLWHDEVFTWSIAQAPSIHDLMRLIRTIDLNPPLSYLITRGSYHLFGVGTLQTRLPEVAGFALAMTCLFLFVRRRAGNSFGILAAAILLAGKASEPAIDGRPYGFLFGFGALALVAWQASVIAQDRGDSGLSSDLLLGASLAAALLTHVFGVFFWFAIATAEFVHIVQSRRISAPRIAALLLPLAATVFYIPIFHTHDAGYFPAAFQAHPLRILDFYYDRLHRELFCLATGLALLAAIGGRAWVRPSRQRIFTLPEWVAVAALALVPIPLILRLALQHASFYFRYGDIATLGLSIAIAALACALTSRSSTAAALLAFVFLAGANRIQYAIKFALQANIFRHAEPAIIPFHPETLTQPGLPIVVNSGIVFIEMNNHEPAATLDRTFYLTGGPIAIHYSHANIFESIPDEIAAFHLKGHTQPYHDFVAQHPHFYLLASDHDFPEDWLLRKLKDDGAQMRLLGHLPNSYRDHNLYDVVFPSHN